MTESNETGPPVICPNCRTSNRGRANFCRRCGRLLVDHCPRCNIFLPPDSDFCDNCGLPLTPAAAQGWVVGSERKMVSSGPSLGGERRPNFSPADDDGFPREESVQSKAPTPPAAIQPSAPSPYPDLDRYIPKELRAKLNAARSQGWMEGERRIVTMLFCDVQGSTAAANKFDPEEWAEIINGAFEHMIRPVYTYEGMVARLTGDGILAFFGAPIAHEDDPDRAVLAGLDIVNGIKPYRDRVRQRHGIDINVRVGINTGMVVVGAVGSDLRMEYTAMGDAINLAARMEQTALPGTVQIAHNTYRAVQSMYEFEDLGGIAVKGKEDPVIAYRVLGRKERAKRSRGIEGLQAPMVGRDMELSTCREVLEMAQQGVGRIVCLIGDAGLGKSRLLSETKQLFNGSLALEWFETLSLSYESNQPYGLFQRLIRRLNGIGPGDSAPEIREKLALLVAEHDDNEQKRALRVLEAMFGLDSADGGPSLEGETFKREFYDTMPVVWRQRFAGRPAVLVFDDIHWSDPASIELLLHLFPLTAEIPLVMLCAFRPDRQGPVWRIKTTADREFHHRYTEIALRPLAEAQVDELVNRLLANAEVPEELRERIRERAGGNPFYVEEVIRGLIDSGALAVAEREGGDKSVLYWQANGGAKEIEIPDNLHGLLAARIDRLEEEPRHLLQMAAVIGRSFYRRVLEAIRNPDNGSGSELERQLGLLLRMDMIREVARLPEMEYKFSNPLTQEVAYQTILLKHRREFHRRVAHAVESLFPDQLTELAPRLAYHFSEGAHHSKAVEYYLLAGDTAARLFANEEAVDHYTHALADIDQVELTVEQLIALFTRRGRALELLSRHEEAMENYEAMLELAQEREENRLKLAALVAQATLRSIRSPVFDSEISLQLSTEALTLARDLGALAEEARIHWNLLLLNMWGTLDFEQGVFHGEAAMAIAREANLSQDLAAILNDLSTAYAGVGRLDAAVRVMAEAQDLLREANNLPLLALNLLNAGSYHFWVGQTEPALQMMDEAKEINLSIDNLWGLAQAENLLGYIYLRQGDWGPAYRCFSQAAGLSERANLREMSAACYLSMATYFVHVGAPAEGFELCQRATSIVGQLFNSLVGWPWSLVSELHLLDNDLPAAQQALQMALANLDADMPLIPTVAPIDLRIAEIRVRIAEGNPGEALDKADDMLVYLSRFHLRQYRPDALLYKGKAMAALGKWDDARQNLQEARQEAERADAQSILWQLLTSLADVESHFGDIALATSLRSQAREIVRGISESISEEEHRAAFLDRPDVRQITESLE